MPELWRRIQRTTHPTARRWKDERSVDDVNASTDIISKPVDLASHKPFARAYKGYST